MTDFGKESIELHKKHGGKLAIVSKVPLNDVNDLSRAYSPGVAEPCLAIAENPELAKTLTIKKNSVAVVSDGSAVLGLGNIGPLASLPVMEGKAILFKEFANIDAWPICLDTQDASTIISTIKRIAPSFGGINLEDIAAPKCFEVEESLQELGIPVFHDDQHGTAIVLLAALMNACKITGKKIEDLKIVVNGAGAAGIAITKLLRCVDMQHSSFIPVKDIIVCDSKGIINWDRRASLNKIKRDLLWYTNRENLTGTVQDALVGADVFVGVSVANLLTVDDVKKMNKDPFLFPMANPDPEILPEDCFKGGASIVGTGRSDFPNQVNNVLAFPGIFRGALDAGAKRISPAMKIAAANALANSIENPTTDKILPDALDKSVALKVAEAVKNAYQPELPLEY